MQKQTLDDDYAHDVHDYQDAMPGHDITLDPSCWIPDFYSATTHGEMDDSELSLWGKCLRAPLPLQIMATNWPLADEINACNSDLDIAITEVIAGNKMSIKDHLNSSIDLFRLSIVQIDLKNCDKRKMFPLSFLSLTDSQKRKKRDPKQPTARSGCGCLLGGDGSKPSHVFYYR